jgi:hypothetical protein
MNGPLPGGRRAFRAGRLGVAAEAGRQGILPGQCPAEVCCALPSHDPALYEHMNDDMDINAGAIVDGTATVADVGEQVFRTILAVASGQETKSESMDYGEQEFVPGHIGTVM